MRVRLTRIDERHHRLEVEREDSWESAELETRSTLAHDLTHYAVERAGGLQDGFFGLLAAGCTLDQLAGRAKTMKTVLTGPSLEIERAVAILQTLVRRDEDPDELFARITDLLALQDARPPAWFTLELVRAVRERLRHLAGRWAATPFGETLELEWPTR